MSKTGWLGGVTAGVGCMVALAVIPAVAEAATPRLLVRTSTPVRGLASSSGWLVWNRQSAKRSPYCSSVIQRRSWATGRVSLVFRCPTYDDGASLAVGSSTVLWTRLFVGGQGCGDLELETRLRSPAPRSRLVLPRRTVGCGGEE